MSELSETMRARAAAGLPPVEGEVRLAGLREPVRVIRDRWGVPHVYASGSHDLYLAQGFVTASERMFQSEVTFRLATGRLSEAFGEMTLPLDRFVRTVGWNRAGRRLLGEYDERSMEMVEAFVAGARAWIDHLPARPVEYDVLGLDPLELSPGETMEAGSSAAVFMSWSLSTNWDVELLRAAIGERLGAEAVAELFPAIGPEAAAVVAGKRHVAGGEALELLRQAPDLPGGQGSNNWVVAGERSVTGKPLLANDPHLLVQMPSAWFEVHLCAPGIDVRGVALPFAPGVVIGHNRRIAWGITNVGGDTQDLYRERLNARGTAAEYEGVWEPLTVHREEIAVRGRPEPEVLEVRESRHGPILDAYLVGLANPRVVEAGVSHPYALRWVGLEASVQPSVVWRLNTAETFEEFRAAVAGWHCPGQNFVYADVDGNIGYQCTGRYPVRRRGDGTVPVPGWTSEHEWDGWVPAEELPWSLNPEEGFLVTANNRIHGDGYPHLIGQDFLPPYRARRIAQLLTATPRHDAASFARIQTDTVSLAAGELLPRLLRLEPRDDRQKEALALLAEWDHDLAADSAAAAIHQVWCRHIGEAVLRPRLGEELFEHYFRGRQWTNTFQIQVLPNLLDYPTAAWFGSDGTAGRDAVLGRTLDAALDELTERLGEDRGAWAWGDLHGVAFAGRLAMIPDLREVFTAGRGPLGGDEQTVMQALFEPSGESYDAVIVPSWRQIVDLSDLDASLGVLTAGQSENPASPHFADQYPLWSTGRHHPLVFGREAVEGAAEGTLELLPERP